MTHFINLDIQRRLTEIKNKIKNEIWYLGFGLSELRAIGP
jgi:hypothetical protein